MKKKNDSLLTEPYQLIRMLWEAVLLVFASIRAAVLGASKASKEQDITPEEAKASYAAMLADLKTDETKLGWKRFLLTGIAIQAFLIVLTLLHVLLGNYIIFLELIVLSGASILLFGYKPWILRNKAVVSFPQYLKKVSKDPGCLILWNSLNQLD